MQRVTKYPLLLKSLLKKTPEKDPDYEYIKASITEIDRIIKAVNEHTRRRDEIARILEIEKQLDCSQIKTPINLSNSVEKNRKLIREGALTRLRLKNRGLMADKSSRKLEKLTLFFFSDILVITKLFKSSPESHTRYIVQVKPLKYSEIAVRNVPEQSNGLGAKNVFLISSQATGTMVLQAISLDEKALWIEDFRKTELLVNSLLKMKELESSPSLQSLNSSEANKENKPENTDNKPEETPERPAKTEQEKEEETLRRRSKTLPPRVANAAKTASIYSVDEEGNPVDSSKTKESEKGKSWLLGLKKPENFLDVTVDQLSQPEFDGWLKVLTKGAFQRHVWKWRYCVLKDFVLYFFLNDDLDSRATSMVVLPNFTISPQKGQNKKFIFEAKHPLNPNNQIIFSAESLEYMSVWVEALNHATHSRIAQRTFWL